VQERETDQVPTTEIRLAVVWNRHMVFPPSQRTFVSIYLYLWVLMQGSTIEVSDTRNYLGCSSLP
jgi:hypothetical protein